MGTPSGYVQNSFNNGEISPNAAGRFDLAKYPNSVKTLENFLIKQLGGVFFRPGTRFVAETKTMTNRSRLLRFLYSTTQNYAIEAGNLYFRFYTQGAQLVDGFGAPIELVTPFAIANIREIKYTQNADTMYLFTGVYPIQKLTRTSATTFTITEVLWKRGPFLDSNITSTTITPSSATGATTLTASSAIFLAGHVGSLWRVAAGVVKITGFTSTTIVTGTVQAEPDGAAGTVGTAAVTDWAEGAWSAVRGYPKCGTFHDGRLWSANTDYQVGGLWGSVSFEYENHDVGAGDDADAINRELSPGDNGVPAIMWLSSGPKNLQAGTSGGPHTIGSGNQGAAITPSNINTNQDSSYGSADVQARRMFNYVYYVQNNLKRILESGYFYDIDQNDARDATLLADHILEALIDDTNIFLRGDASTGGVYDMDVQKSPNNRLWAVRDDGQMAVMTRNPREEVIGWCRLLAGATISCDGKSGTGQFESTVILPQDGDPDVIWVQTNRLIAGAEKRFIEYFTSEEFKYVTEAVRLDCSLTYDNPLEITAIDLATATITAVAHGFSNGDQVKLDNIVGTHQLNGTKWLVGNVTADTFALITEIT